MRLAVLKERRDRETRVAASPDTVKKLAALGVRPAIEAGAGVAAGIADAEFRDAGAEIVPDAAAALAGAGAVFAVNAPGPEARAAMAPGTLLVCVAAAFRDAALLPDCAARGIDLVGMEMLPRITRAQSMDVLSSQANLAGYRAVIEGAGAFARGFPMMMTAAGTVPPARVLVIGAGVAGLQAIATARRLGGIVSATDVRPAAREEIRSLGATFVGIEDEETKAAQTAGGYAREMSDEYKRKQAELLASAVARSDLVICTALLVGRAAPRIVTAEMVAAMRSGSVIVDLAAEAGGNCAATVADEVVTTANGVTVLGWSNWAARIGVAASLLYARNLATFLTTFWDRDAGAPVLPETDDIVRGVMLTRGGAIVHPLFAGQAAADAPEPTPPSGPEAEPVVAVTDIQEAGAEERPA